MQEHLDYDLVESSNPAFAKAIVRINVFRNHRQVGHLPRLLSFTFYNGHRSPGDRRHRRVASLSASCWTRPPALRYAW